MHGYFCTTVHQLNKDMTGLHFVDELSAAKIKVNQ